MPGPLLALFPLELVLFPGMSLPLHIFEPRYRQMVRDCQEQQAPFGVIYRGQGRQAAVGCSAAIAEVLRTYPDGRLDILGRGLRRFRLLASDEALPYLRGDVEWLDEPEEELGGERERMIDLYRRTYWAHAQGLSPASLYAERHPSFVVARSQLMGLDDRQKLLEMGSERERLEALSQALTSLEPVVRRLGGNGHGL